jgi:hypothetical protein
VNSLYGSLEGPGAYYRDIYIQTALGMRKIQQIYAASLRKAQFCLSVRRLAFACRCGAVRWVEVPRIAPPRLIPCSFFVRRFVFAFFVHFLGS